MLLRGEAAWRERELDNVFGWNERGAGSRWPGGEGGWKERRSELSTAERGCVAPGERPPIIKLP